MPPPFAALWLAATLVLLPGCAPAVPRQPRPPQEIAAAAATTPPPTQTRPPAPGSTAAASPSPQPSVTPAPPTPSPTAPSPPTATIPAPSPSPFEPLTIEAMAARPYGGSGILVGERLEEQEAFTRYTIRYPSDGLWISGNLNLPRGAGPFPVILLNHGYYDPARYVQGDGTRAAADALAGAGYLTLATDYRGYAGSDDGANPFRMGYVVDVMNLLAQVDSLPDGWAAPRTVGLWGHSMGGGITVHVAVLAGERVSAAVVYGGMSSDVAASTRHVLALWQRADYVEPVERWGGPEQESDAYRRMSALFALERSAAAFSIHHGSDDEQVPYPWSEELRDAAALARRPVEHFGYPGAPHSFRGETWELFISRVIAFYDRTLARP